MEILLLPFGNLTMAFSFLVGTLLALSGVFWLGIKLVNLLLAADDVNAPDYNFKNILWEKMSGIMCTKTTTLSTKHTIYIPDVICKKDGKWFVLDLKSTTATRPYYVDLTNGGFSLGAEGNIRKYCMATSESRAVRTAEKFYKNTSYKRIPYIYTKESSLSSTPKGVMMFLACVVADLALVLFSYAPTTTISLLSIVGVVYGVRTLAKKVYSNSAKIKQHNTRIVDLEHGDKGDINE